MTGDAARIVVLGSMSRYPVAGMVWLTMQYVVGFARLGHDVWYVETNDGDPSYVADMMSTFGLPDRWAVDLRGWSDETHGVEAQRLDRLYATADRIINLHGGTKPLDQQLVGGSLVFLETDPGAVASHVRAGAQGTVDFLAQHATHFTWGENYGADDCGVPPIPGFDFRRSRQPVILDLWQSSVDGTSACFTTIGNWRQGYKEVEVDGETYHWTKHLGFLEFLELPRLSAQQFELALASYEPSDRALLESNGWNVKDAASVSSDPDAYRNYVSGSRAEFTVAKDQYVRLRTGWVGDRSPTYLAAGRPVVLQDTGFGNVLPTGEGLFAVSTVDDVLAAVERINGDYPRHSQAASEIAREYFAHDVVLPPLLS